jgi:hypothetical protein
MFSLRLREADFLESHGPSKGAVIRSRNGRGDFEWTTLSTVVDCEAPRLFRWATGDDDDPAATWSLEATPFDGGVVVTHSVEFHAGMAPRGPAIAKQPERTNEIVSHRLAEVLANMKATIEGIAVLTTMTPA